MKTSLFDNWAENYEKDILKFQNQYPFVGYFKIIDEIVNILELKNCRSILDIGVGSGYMLNKILERKPMDYLGIDFSEKMLEIAKSKLTPENFIQYNVGNAVPQKIRKRKFDCILSAFTLHHFDTAEKLNIIDNYFSLLPSEGEFIIADISFESASDMLEVKKQEGKKWDTEE